MEDGSRTPQGLLIDPDIAEVLGLSSTIDPEEFMLQDEVCRLEDNLYEFMKAAWHLIDPAPFSDNWHLDAIAEHLEHCCFHDAEPPIKRLIINIPPRCSKSSILVCFVAWVWAQPVNSHTSGPGVQFMCGSYAQNLSLRDSLKVRRLVESAWYQKRWPRVQITDDQNTKTEFQTTAGGYRLSISIGGQTTGHGGNIIILDDPNNVKDIESEADRLSAINWFDGSISTRLNNANEGVVIVVQQRVHEEDITGHILSTEPENWVHLMLPMEYEKDRAELIYPNLIGFSDPRTEEKELLVPDRFDRAAVESLTRRLGTYRAAGQLQQRPAPKGGGILKRHYWKDWDKAEYPACSLVIGSVDTAYTEKQENDYSAMTIWGVFEDEYENVKVVMMHAWKGRYELHDLVERIAMSAKKFRIDTLLVENKAAGISVAQEIRRLYRHEDYGVLLEDPKASDKVARAYSVQHIFEEGYVHAPLDRAWADGVVTECEQFPKAKNDDLTDTVVQAIRYLRRIGVLVRGPERTAELAESMLHQNNRPQKPLYPV